MISIRRFFPVLFLMIGLQAMAFNVFSAGIDPPAVSRGKLPVEQPPSVRPTDQNLDRPYSVGVQEFPRPEGGRDVIYYSVTPPEEKQARQQAEAHKQEQSLEILKNGIIIKR
jgi:hypothetical protein